MFVRSSLFYIQESVFIDKMRDFLYIPISPSISGQAPEQGKKAPWPQTRNLQATSAIPPKTGKKGGVR